MASYPDMPAYRVLAITLGQAGYLDELFELMQTLRQGPEKNGKFLPLVDNGRLIPDVVVYNAVSTDQKLFCSRFKLSFMDCVFGWTSFVIAAALNEQLSEWILFRISRRACLIEFSD